MSPSRAADLTSPVPAHTIGMAQHNTFSIIPMEYIVCQNQKGTWSVVTRAHVREDRHPMMEVVMGRNQVVFNLTGLDDGRRRAAKPGACCRRQRWP